MHLGAQFVQQPPDDRCIGACGGEDQFSCIDRTAFNGIGQSVFSAVDQFLGNSMVVALRELLCKIPGKDIMTCGGQSVAAHAAIVTGLVCRLSGRRKTDDHIARTDVCIVDYILAAHTASDCRIHDNRADKVAHIGCLAPRRIDADSHPAHISQELVGTIDDGRYYFARHKQLVAADSRADQDIVYRPHTEQVVRIHDDGILCDAAPYADVPGLLPVHISE